MQIVLTGSWAHTGTPPNVAIFSTAPTDAELPQWVNVYRNSDGSNAVTAYSAPGPNGFPDAVSPSSDFWFYSGSFPKHGWMTTGYEGTNNLMSWFAESVADTVGPSGENIRTCTVYAEEENAIRNIDFVVVSNITGSDGSAGEYYPYESTIAFIDIIDGDSVMQIDVSAGTLLTTESAAQNTRVDGGAPLGEIPGSFPVYYNFMRCSPVAGVSLFWTNFKTCRELA